MHSPHRDIKTNLYLCAELCFKMYCTLIVCCVNRSNSSQSLSSYAKKTNDKMKMLQLSLWSVLFFVCRFGARCTCWPCCPWSWLCSALRSTLITSATTGKWSEWQSSSACRGLVWFLRATGSGWVKDSHLKSCRWGRTEFGFKKNNVKIVVSDLNPYLLLFML